MVNLNLAPTAIDSLAESVIQVTHEFSENVPVIGNVNICADSICTTN